MPGTSGLTSNCTQEIPALVGSSVSSPGEPSAMLVSSIPSPAIWDGAPSPGLAEDWMDAEVAPTLLLSPFAPPVSNPLWGVLLGSLSLGSGSFLGSSFASSFWGFSAAGFSAGGGAAAGLGAAEDFAAAFCSAGLGMAVLMDGPTVKCASVTAAPSPPESHGNDGISLVSGRLLALTSQSARTKARAPLLGKPAPKSIRPTWLSSRV
mmetsp:Transcript_45538/g.120297  ORF Transcript_45538/g.120297 Transcript_45538/m.120297 type:complete len:207 (-) Transcript_45538:1445-2065(-)